MKKFIHLLAILALMLSSSIVYASHAVGGDVEYECIGPRKWKIRLTLYRDCTGVPLCSNMGCTQKMYVKPNASLNPLGCSATPNLDSLTLSLVKVEDINKAVGELCGSSAKNGCTNLGQVTAGTYSPSIEKYIFEGTLDLSAPSLNNATCAYWDVYWESCCRNAYVWNLASSSGQGYRIGATINIFNRSVSPLKNNSPIFKNEAVTNFCSGQEYVLNMGAIDPDGDSLTYEIAPAIQQGGIPVNYQPPGSANYPFPLNSTKVPHINLPQPNGPYVVMDSTNGDFTFNALNNTAGYINGNLNIRIKQWSYDANGYPVLVGITQRDLQLYVFNCPGNNPPSLATIPSGPNNTPIYEYSVCAGDSLGFTVIAKDTDIYPSIQRADTTYLSWNEAIVRPGKLTFGPTYTVGAGLPRPREDTWLFSWKTEGLDGRRLPYYFTTTALDKFCPNVGRVTRAFKITVFKSPTFTISKTDLRCGNISINLYKNAPYESLQTASLQITTTPNDRNFTNGIRSIATISINPQGSQFDSIAQPRLMYSDSFRYTQPGKYYIRYNYYSPGTSCTFPIIDSIEIYQDSILTAHTIALGDTSFCFGDSVTLSNQFNKPNYKYQWQLNSSNLPNKTANNLIVKQSGVYRLQITDTVINCNSFAAPINVFARPIPNANFEASKNCVFTSLNNTFIDKSTITSGHTLRKWHFGTSDTDTNKTVVRTYPNKGSLSIKLVSTSNFGCVDSISKTYIIDTGFNVTYAPGSSFCTPDTTLLIIPLLPNYNYQWLKNNTVITGATNNNYAATQSGLYKLIYTNLSTNCIDTAASQQLDFYPKPVASAFLSAFNLCIKNNNIVYNDNSTIQTGSFTRIWNFGDGTTSTLKTGGKSYNNIGSYNIKLVVTSGFGCKDSMSAAVNILNPPNAAISINGSTSICEGNLVQLSSASYPTSNYYWYRNNQLINNADTNNLSVTLGGSYKLIVDNGQNCKDTSNTITVQVYPKPKVGFTVNNAIQCLNNNLFLVADTSSISSGSISRTFTWGSSSSSLPSLNLNFATIGNHQVQLKATSNNGCSDSISKTITVSGYPTIDTISGLANALSTQLTYNYSISPQPNHTYNWSLTNGSIISGQGTNNITAQWTTPGTGQVKATITNANGCSKDTSKAVTILNFPPFISFFTPQTGTNGTVVTINGGNFTNASAVTFGGVNAKSFNVVSNTVVSAIVDTGATGSVSVVTPSGTALLNTFTYTSNTGVAEIGTQSFSVFPNPVTSEIVIESNQLLNQTTFELIDANGKIVISKTCNNAISKYTIDVKELNPSIYLLRITSQGQSNTVKMIKQ